MWNTLKASLGLRIAMITVSVVVFFCGGLAAVGLGFDLFGSNTKFFVGSISFYSVGLVLILLVLQFLLYSFFVGKPLAALRRNMRRVKEGSWNEVNWSGYNAEFARLGQEFNQMLRELKQISQNRKQIEQRLIKAEESLKYKMALEDKAKIIERMNKELSGAFNDISLLYTVSQYLSSILKIDELVHCVDGIFREKFSCEAFALYFLLPGRKRLRLAAYKGIAIEGENQIYEPVQVGLVGEVLNTSKSLYLKDIEDWKGSELLPSETGLRGSVFSVPLKLREGAIGVLTVCRASETGFSPTDRQSLESIASQIAIAYERSKLYMKTKDLAVRDELTGAYNRRRFQQMFQLELKRSRRFHRALSVLIIDIDHFKKFNDTYGHLVGDELLKNFTSLIEANIREVDLLARFGGEEFVILLSDTSGEDACFVADKLCTLVRTASLAKGDEGEDLNVTISVGVASYPEAGDSPEEIIANADTALYQAKDAGRDQVVLYNSEPSKITKLQASNTNS
ncbi:MAG: diguanylate cyclase [Deltaproteobacteria bacterium]|nr:diguanylate cyclase [Deltaproteobacteria bacterium]